MGRRGRPQKAGKRRNGRPVPAVQIVKGNDRAEARKARYGTLGGDCLGRAYVAGLLGEGDIAKDRLDLARKYARLYGKAFDRPYRCALNDNPRGLSNREETDFDRYGEEWMRDNQALIAPEDAPYFDQLVLPVSPLDDPHWMADLLTGNEGVNDSNRQILNAALRGIDALCQRPPARKRKGVDLRSISC